jgi:hypothetical protein
MNRDTMPTGAAIALATGELMVTARRLTARLPRLADQTPEGIVSAAVVVRAGILELWPKVPPEAVRDVMASCAEAACEAGVTEIPEAVAAAFPGQLDGAEGMLEMTHGQRSGEYPGRAVAPPVAFASSVAFDRDEDEQTLASLSVLLTLAHLAIL